MEIVRVEFRIIDISGDDDKGRWAAVVRDGSDGPNGRRCLAPEGNIIRNTCRPFAKVVAGQRGPQGKVHHGHIRDGQAAKLRVKNRDRPCETEEGAGRVRAAHVMMIKPVGRKGVVGVRPKAPRRETLTVS